MCAHSGQRAGPNCEQTVTQSIPHTLHPPDGGYCERIHCDEGCNARVHAGCTEPSERHAKGGFACLRARLGSTAPSCRLRPTPRWREDCAPDEVTDQMEVVRPVMDARVCAHRLGERGRVLLEAAHQTPGTAIHWHLDDTYLGTTYDLHQWPASPAPGTWPSWMSMANATRSSSTSHRPRGRPDLLVAEDDTTLGQVVRRHRHRHAVAEDHTNSVTSELPCEVRMNLRARVGLYEEVAAREHFFDHTFDFNQIVRRQVVLLVRAIC